MNFGTLVMGFRGNLLRPDVATEIGFKDDTLRNMEAGTARKTKRAAHVALVDFYFKKARITRAQVDEAKALIDKFCPPEVSRPTDMKTVRTHDARVAVRVIR